MTRLDRGPAAVAHAPAPESTIAGDVRAHLDFPSRHTGQVRDVLVYLPPGYDHDARRRYPVLYCQDGQNMMDAATAFLGVEWRLDETLESGIDRGEIAPLIAVCVANTPARAEEYTPVVDPVVGGGQADRYIAFLREELMPFVDACYRTRGGPRATGLLGSSLGGLLALHGALDHWRTFGRVAAISPSFWWAAGEILDRMARVRPGGNARLWIDMGTREGGQLGQAISPDPMIYAGRWARDLLVAGGMRLDDDLKYVEAPCAEHTEGAWAERLPWVLRYLFPGPVPTGLPWSARAAPAKPWWLTEISSGEPGRKRKSRRAARRQRK